VRKLIINVLVLSFDNQFFKLKLPPNTYIVGKRDILEVTHLSNFKEDLIIRFYVTKDKSSLTRFLKSEYAEKIDILLVYYGENILESLNTAKEHFPSAETLIVGSKDVDLTDVVASDVRILNGNISFQKIVWHISQVLETAVKAPFVFSAAQLREEITILKNFILKLDDDLRKRVITVKEYFEDKKRLEERINVLEKRLMSIVGKC